MHERISDPRAHHAAAAAAAAELHTPARPSGAHPREATRATAAGTRRFAERGDVRRMDFQRILPRRLTVSALGLGTYLGDCTDEDDQRYTQTVHAAVLGGINLIDTASNYRCQRSERAVGRALEEMIASGEARRDELVVCTKGGYVALDGTPPASREAYEAWLEETLVAPGVVARDDLVRA